MCRAEVLLGYFRLLGQFRNLTCEKILGRRLGISMLKYFKAGILYVTMAMIHRTWVQFPGKFPYTAHLVYWLLGV